MQRAISLEIAFWYLHQDWLGGADGGLRHSSRFSSRYCAQGHAGARAVKRLRITPVGTPRLSWATASARASTIALTSARIALIRSSRLGARAVFIDILSLIG